ncbi:glycerophosphodiester phosphodiesterase [Maribellus sp. YY47]|uniref:glycerophosphodiester phosphodiesterase n=1 Tax=Maribellus sp. YY47 TaxID=2929486 RepID=UPI0020007561|nr:glycerophosphodiester phosphodiesterase [Maribellus sp. YY47]MCK3683515.1 glycerophosphodiester phosphodiesterase [Maribellus sp. YY47]
MKTTFLLFFFIAASLSVLAQVEFVGHRGASYLAPENTVAAAKLGWELGADGVEIDIYLTPDNRIVAIHDKNTKRTTGADHIVPETTSKELRKLDAGKWKDEKYTGEKIPFVEEVLKNIPKGRYLVIEIKTGPEIMPVLEKAIKKSGKAKQVKFIAFNWESIVAAQKAFPKNDCYWLTSVEKDLDAKISECAAVGLKGVDVNSKLVTSENMAKAKELGLDVWCWTVDSPEEAKRVADLGVSSITTNRPGWLREQLK